MDVGGGTGDQGVSMRSATVLAVPRGSPHDAHYIAARDSDGRSSDCEKCENCESERNGCERGDEGVDIAEGDTEGNPVRHVQVRVERGRVRPDRRRVAPDQPTVLDDESHEDDDEDEDADAKTSWADLTASDMTCVAARAALPEGALSPVRQALASSSAPWQAASTGGERNGDNTTSSGIGALCGAVGALTGSEQHAVHTLRSMVKKYVEVIPGWSCQEWTTAIKEVQTDLIEGSDVWWAAERLAQHGGFDHVIKHRKAKGGGRQVHVTFKTESTTVMQYQFEVPNEDEEEALELAARIVIAQTVLAMGLHALLADARTSGHVQQVRETTVMTRRLRRVFAAVFAPDAATRTAMLKGADEL